jgi:hypothetical protein
MNDNSFRDHIRSKLDESTPDVLQQIKADPRFVVPPKPSPFGRWFGMPSRSLATLAGVFVVALLVVFSIRQLRDPVVASTVTLDVNPSIVITLDEDDTVINVTAQNDDGDTIVSRNIRYRGMTIEEVVEILVTRLEAAGYLVTTDTETNVILIDVDADEDAIRSRVEAAFQARLNARMERIGAPHWVLNARDIPQDGEPPTMPGMDMHTRARRLLIYRIHQLDDEYTYLALSRMTLRELYDLFIELEDPANLPDYDHMPGHRMPPANPFGGETSCSCMT